MPPISQGLTFLTCQMGVLNCGLSLVSGGADLEGDSGQFS